MSEIVAIECPTCGGPGGELAPEFGWRSNCAACDAEQAEKERVRVEALKAEALRRWADGLGEKYAKSVRHEVLPPLRGAFASSARVIGFVGGVRLGKSSAMACLVLTVPLQPFLWVSLPGLRDLFLTARTGESYERAAARQELDRLERVPLLCLDDLSQAVVTEAFAEILFSLLEERERAGRRLFWTSNEPLPQLAAEMTRTIKSAKRADAICGRLAEGAEIFTI